MHEMSLAEGVLQLVTDTARREAATRVKTVVLEMLGRPEKWYAAYSHLSRIDVELGEPVKIGEQIGLTGNTGNASTMKGLDQHLHFELRTTPTPGKGLEGRLSPIKLFGVCPLDKPVVQ